MAIIMIENIDYGLDSMSDEYRVQLASIQFREKELPRLQAQAAYFQISKAAYLQALQSTLPVVNVSGTKKLT